MRATTELTARATARSGSLDSPAAIVTISAPTNANITITTPDKTVAPATASTASTIAQKYQYSQPTLKPAHGPSAWRQYSTNEPTCGLATAISPSIRII